MRAEDQSGVHGLERHGLEPETVIVRLKTHVGHLELQEEWLKKRFELPPYLKQFATNLNLLARQAGHAATAAFIRLGAHGPRQSA